MNIQIFGKAKCFASRASERFFKERKISYQFINLTEKVMSSREFDAILAAVKDIDALIDTKSPLYEKLNVAYIFRSTADKKELLLSNPALFLTPIVRECQSKKCTVGPAEAVWREWLG